MPTANWPGESKAQDGSYHPLEHNQQSNPFFRLSMHQTNLADFQVPDAWIARDKLDERDGKVGIVGYEINFNRYFYVYQPPRPLEELDAELKGVEAEIAALLSEVTR